MFYAIDDLSDVLDVLKELIEYPGYEVLCFASAEKYLEYFDSPEFIAPIAILTDYMMMGQNGLELIKKVREKIPFQKAVMLSGTPCADLDASLESYLCYSLQKPYKPEKLFSVLKILIECEQHSSFHSKSNGMNCIFGLDHACPFHPYIPGQP